MYRRGRILAAVLVLAVGIASAADEQDPARGLAERLLDDLGARPVPCPKRERIYRQVRTAHCAKTRLGLRQLQQRVTELARGVSPDVGPWREDGPRHSMWFQVDRRPFQVNYDPDTRRLMLHYPRPYPRCTRLPETELGDGGSSEPRRVNYVPPEFPEPARHERAEGMVVLMVRVDLEGRAEACVLEESEIPGVGFEQAAVEAAQRWRYDPATRNGEPVERSLRVEVEFRR